MESNNCEVLCIIPKCENNGDMNDLLRERCGIIINAQTRLINSRCVTLDFAERRSPMENQRIKVPSNGKDV